MNASRRTARKYQVRMATETLARKEKMSKRKLHALLDRVHTFLCNAHHKVITKQARQLGIIN